MGGEHSQNVRLDSAIGLLYTPSDVRQILQGTINEAHWVK
jgi:hypothetical protein